MYHLCMVSYTSLSSHNNRVADVEVDEENKRKKWQRNKEEKRKWAR